MGVTIHYQGKLTDRNNLNTVIEICQDFASKHQWIAKEVSTDKTLMRLINEQQCDYTGHVQGVILQPGELCEPLEFEFDASDFLQSYCKTQFAGAAIHMLVVDLLRQLSVHFDPFVVQDEGEFWDTNDQKKLTERLEACNTWMRDTVTQRPDYEGPIVQPDGRILDLVRKTSENPPEKPKSWIQKIFNK